MSAVFTEIKLGLCIWGKTTTEVKRHSHHIFWEYVWLSDADIGLGSPGWSSVCQVSPLWSHPSLPSSCILSSLGRSQSAQPSLTEWGVMSRLCKGRIPIQIIQSFTFLLKRRFLALLFINFILIYLFPSIFLKCS